MILRLDISYLRITSRRSMFMRGISGCNFGRWDRFLFRSLRRHIGLTSIRGNDQRQRGSHNSIRDRQLRSILGHARGWLQLWNRHLAELPRLRLRQRWEAHERRHVISSESKWVSMDITQDFFLEPAERVKPICWSDVRCNIVTGTFNHPTTTSSTH